MGRTLMAGEYTECAGEAGAALVGRLVRRRLDVAGGAVSVGVRRGVGGVARAASSARRSAPSSAAVGRVRAVRLAPRLRRGARRRTAAALSANFWPYSVVTLGGLAARSGRPWRRRRPRAPRPSAPTCAATGAAWRRELLGSGLDAGLELARALRRSRPLGAPAAPAGSRPSPASPASPGVGRSARPEASSPAACIGSSSGRSSGTASSCRARRARHSAVARIVDVRAIRRTTPDRRPPTVASQQRLRVDVDRPRRTGRPSSRRDRVVAAEDDVEPPPVGAPRDVRGRRAGDLRPRARVARGRARSASAIAVGLAFGRVAVRAARR